MAKHKLLLGFALVAVCAAVGYFVIKPKPNKEEAKVADIFIYDSSLGEAYSVFKKKTVVTSNPASILPNRVLVEEMKVRSVKFLINDTANKEIHYDLRWHDPGKRKWRSPTSLMLNGEILEAFPIQEGDKSVPCQLRLTNGKKKVIWSGVIGQDSRECRWQKDKLLSNHNGVIWGLVKPEEIDNVHLKAETDTGDDAPFVSWTSEDGSVYISGINEKHFKKPIRIVRQEFETVFEGPIAYGKPGDARDVWPPVEKPEIIRVQDNHGAVWKPDGTRIEDPKVDSQLDGNLGGGNDLRKVRVELPLIENEMPHTAISYQKDWSRLSGIQSYKMSKRPGATMDYFITLKPGFETTDLDLTVSTGKATLAKTLRVCTDQALGDQNYKFRDAALLSGMAVIAKIEPGKFSQFKLYLKNGYESMLLQVMGPSNATLHEATVPAYVKREDIDRVEIWTYPTKVYTFKNVALQPKK